MPSPPTLAVFIVPSLALLLIPGPGVLYIVARGIHQGRRAALVSGMLRSPSGCCLWNPRVLLHRDCWPGNVLWKDGRLAGVIDWEDVAVGDPLSDLGNTRLELLFNFGLDAMEAFTPVYASRIGVDLTHLPYSDLAAAL